MRSVKCQVLATSALALFATAVPALAQQPADQPSVNSGLQDIVVTARRREESLQSVPVPSRVRPVAIPDRDLIRHPPEYAALCFASLPLTTSLKS